MQADHDADLLLPANAARTILITTWIYPLNVGRLGQCSKKAGFSQM